MFFTVADVSTNLLHGSDALQSVRQTRQMQTTCNTGNILRRYYISSVFDCRQGIQKNKTKGGKKERRNVVQPNLQNYITAGGRFDLQLVITLDTHGNTEDLYNIQKVSQSFNRSEIRG